MPPLVAVMYKLVAAKEPDVWVMEPEAVRLMVLVPVSAMSLVTAKSPVIVAVTLPLPPMDLSMLVLTFLLNDRVALFDSVTPGAVPRLPVAPPLPTCKVPAVTVVVPE